MQSMPLRLPIPDSLRHKTLFGFAAVALLTVSLAAFSLIEMRLLETQIRAGERISQFLGVVLEMRRFEKNYFLYGQTSDLEETRRYLEQARQVLASDAAPFARLAEPQRIDQLRTTLERYEALMTDAAARDAERQGHIREAGKTIATFAEGWSQREREILQGQLERHQQWLLGSVALVVAAMLLIARLLASGVARPLGALEDSMAAIAAGHRHRLDLPTNDREIASLASAFNHMLQELELRRGQLQRSEKLAALGTLLSGVAHELNNPLSNISTSCEILREELGADGTALQRDMLAQVHAETWRARRIVRSLLDYARDRDFQREALPLRPLIEDSLRLVRGRLGAGTAVHVYIAPELEVAGDSQRLQQAFVNLVANAADALDDTGEITIDAHVTHAPWPAEALSFGPIPADAPSVEIRVKDNGKGIAADILPRVFDPFFTTKEVGHGLGLGLFIVFEIIEEHGGGIAVTSAPGHGTCFFVRLPLPETAP